MATYDETIRGYIDGNKLCDVIDEQLVSLLNSLPSGEAQGRTFSGALTNAQLAARVAAFDINGPEVLIFEGGAAGDKALVLNLSKLPTSAIEDVKGLLFDTQRSVSIKGLNEFGGVIELGGGNDKVKAKLATEDITVCTNDGNDKVVTGAGIDTVVIGAGKDTVSTGAGRDKIELDDNSDGGKVNAGLGNDEIIFGSGFSGGSGVKITINGSEGVDSLDLSTLKDIAIFEAKKISGGVKITLDDNTILIVKNVEHFSYLDTGVVKTVGLLELLEAFPSFG